MNIALIGYGKMGKAIEAIAVTRGHQVPVKIDINSKDFFTKAALDTCDVAIEFTGPESAAENITTCLNAGIPVISGSTGWLADLPAIEARCQELDGTILYASNFSIGVNIFFELNRRLAKLMSGLTDYKVSLEETHHTEKKDHPSGTAITLAEQVLQAIPSKTKWVEGTAAADELSITSKRIDPAAGTHIVKYSSAVDDIEIIHTAHNRTGFATGAILAAEFVAGKKGIFTMRDVLNITA